MQSSHIGFDEFAPLLRQREGIAKAKAEGKYKGRKATPCAKTSDRVLAQEGLTKALIAERLGISQRSVFLVLASA